MRKVLINALCIILTACGGGDSSDAPAKENPTSTLPVTGEITSQELLDSGNEEDGYYSMSIDEEADLTLNLTDSFVLANDHNGIPQKLTVSGNLTITK
ncbi:hypothetical protein BCU83_13765 [Vibrio breoganii]|uniref:hypothetical protein n=1 Tax=Vibrio breoganii TaxID=553239 RepID=UPI000C817205|nr:hypothetical protein [Vibrio breoganii]PMG79279.1 hypothetical protein BCU83_13765 [Vibrio breoganii]